MVQNAWVPTVYLRIDPKIWLARKTPRIGLMKATVTIEEHPILTHPGEMTGPAGIVN